MSTRIDVLIGKLAEAFDDGRTFDGNFLREHNVTADECRDVENLLAVILYAYTNAPRDIKNLILVAGALQSDEMHVAPIIWMNGLGNVAMTRAAR